MKTSKIETAYFEGMSEQKWRTTSGPTRLAMPNNRWVCVHTKDGLLGGARIPMQAYPICSERGRADGH